VTAYRFCRTDDMAVLVEAHNRCWLPHFPGEPAWTVERFKRAVRELDLWCSSCMVAFEGKDPVGVRWGAKRPTETLVQRIAVHPEHLRRGHGRHLLASLGSKLSILGPPRIVAEVPDGLPGALALFEAGGYEREELLTDWERPREGPFPEAAAAGGLLVPVGVDDLAANGLLTDETGTSWAHHPRSLVARKDRLAGIALAEGDALVAFALFEELGPDGIEVVALCSTADGDPLARLHALVRALARRSAGSLRLAALGAREVPAELLDAWGFRPVRAWFRMATLARRE
jgi:GNAT superfamily N-acetyltransferase